MAFNPYTFDSWPQRFLSDKDESEGQRCVLSDKAKISIPGGGTHMGKKRMFKKDTIMVKKIFKKKILKKN